MYHPGYKYGNIKRKKVVLCITTLSKKKIVSILNIHGSVTLMNTY